MCNVRNGLIRGRNAAQQTTYRLAQLVELAQQSVLELDKCEHRAQLPQKPPLFGLDKVAQPKVGVSAPCQELLDDPKEGNVGPRPSVQLVRQVFLGGDGLKGGRPSGHVQVFFGNALAIPELQENGS